MFSRIAALTESFVDCFRVCIYDGGLEASASSCELTAIEEGEILMIPDGQWLVSEGVKPAVLGYKGRGVIKSFSSSVHYNGQ